MLLLHLLALLIRTDYDDDNDYMNSNTVGTISFGVVFSSPHAFDGTLFGITEVQ